MPETIPGSIGSVLRSARLHQGKALDVIAAKTKICHLYLEAIENDQFDTLPEGAYRRSFLRQYASALGLDGEELVTAYRNQYGEELVKLPEVPKRQPFKFLRGTGSVLLAALALAGLYKISLSECPECKIRAIQQPRIPAQKIRTEPPARTSVPEDKPAAHVRVVFTSTEPVWISVTCDGTPTFTGTLAQTETRSFEASAALIVLIGNAGALAITLNGHPVGPIGARGEIQLLELTPQGPRRLPRTRGVPPAQEPQA